MTVITFTGIREAPSEPVCGGRHIDDEDADGDAACDRCRSMGPAGDTCVRPLQTERKDYLGDPLPDGYEQWVCDFCTAACNFEAMNWCQKRWDKNAECGFDRDKPESNHGCFALIRKKT